MEGTEMVNYLLKINGVFNEEQEITEVSNEIISDLNLLNQLKLNGDIENLYDYYVLLV
jgi:hypothetical protein